MTEKKPNVIIADQGKITWATGEKTLILNGIPAVSIHPDSDIDIYDMASNIAKAVEGKYLEVTIEPIELAESIASERGELTAFNAMEQPSIDQINEWIEGYKDENIVVMLKSQGIID